MSKIACYLRTSTEDQGGGLATQRAECARYCEQHGLAAPVFYADEISGTIPFEQREAGGRLLEDVRAGKVRLVVTYKRDRLARETVLVLLARDMLQQAGAEIAYAAESSGDGEDGRLMDALHAALAERVRRDIVARTSAGLRRKTREGGWSGGRAPFGYSIEAKHLVVDDEPIAGTDLTPAEVVRRVFAWVAEGVSSRMVAERLGGLGIPAPDGGRGGAWVDSTVRRLVKNPLYRGTRRWGRRTRVKGCELAEGVCPAIVTVGVWEAAQAGLARNFTYAKRNRRREYLLSGLVRCELCGSRYCGTTSSGLRVYVCGGRRHKGCQARQVRADELEAAIWSDCEDFIRAPGAVLEELARKQAEGRPGTAFAARRARALKAQLARKRSERERVITLHRRGAIDEAEVGVQLDALRREQEALAADIAKLEDADARAREAEARLTGAAGLLAALGRRLDSGLSYEAKRRVVEALVDAVEVTTRGARAQRDINVAAAYAFAVPAADCHAHANGCAYAVRVAGARGTVDGSHWPEQEWTPAAARSSGLHAETRALEERRLRETLERTRWNKSRAARALGLSRQGLLKKLRRYGLVDLAGVGVDAAAESDARTQA
jgi:site-specific DNA recombinase